MRVVDKKKAGKLDRRGRPQCLEYKEIVEAALGWLRSKDYETGVLECPLSDAKFRSISLQGTVHFTRRLLPFRKLFSIYVGKDGDRIYFTKRGRKP